MILFLLINVSYSKKQNDCINDRCLTYAILPLLNEPISTTLSLDPILDYIERINSFYRSVFHCQATVE